MGGDGLGALEMLFGSFVSMVVRGRDKGVEGNETVGYTYYIHVRLTTTVSDRRCHGAAILRSTRAVHTRQP